MNKDQFLNVLSRRLENLPDTERRIALDYFSELISDRMEEGMTEEDAVAALGGVDQIVQSAALQTRAQSENAAPSAERRQNHTILHAPVRSVYADCSCANISVLRGALPDGATALVEYRLPNGAECGCNLEDGQLKIEYLPQHRSFSLMDLFRSESNVSIQVTLAGDPLEHCKIITSSGDVMLANLNLSGSLSASSSSGDVTLKNISAQDECSVSSHSGELKLYTLDCRSLLVRSASGAADLQNARAEDSCTLRSTSGDMLIVSIQCGGALQLHSTSGDVEARDVSAADVSACATSGDVSLLRVVGHSVSVESTSGDVELDIVCADAGVTAASRSGDIELANLQGCGAVTSHSTSGDIELRNAEAQRFELSTTSGDIEGVLIGQYHFHARSASGDVHVPDSRGERIAEARSVSGDIDLRSR